MRELEDVMQEHYLDMKELENTVKELEENRPLMGRYGHEALRFIQTQDSYRYFQLLLSGNLFERILAREEQALTRLRTIIDQQEELEKVESIEDFMKKVAIRRQIKLEADSTVMREIVLQPM